MPQQCYLIDGRLKFYIVPEDTHLEYKGSRQDMSKQQAKLLQYMFEHNTDGTIAVDAILKNQSLDKKALMQLLFEINKKCKSLGFAEDGFMLNGNHYLITWRYELIDGYLHQLQQMQGRKLRLRRYIFVALALGLALGLLA